MFVIGLAGFVVGCVGVSCGLCVCVQGVVLGVSGSLTSCVWMCVCVCGVRVCCVCV